MSRRSLLLALTIAALLSGVGLWISQHEPTEDPNRPSSSNGSTSTGGTSTTELFGPDTKKALKTLEDEMAKRKKTGKSELLDLLIAYKHEDMFRLEKPRPEPQKAHGGGLVQLGGTSR